MKKFIVNCDFGGQPAPFAVYIGVPEGGHHPLHFQADWLSKNRGGAIPPNIMDAIGRLKDIATKNKVSLEELCVYALGAAQQEKDQGGDSAEGASESSEGDEDLDFDDLFDEDDDDLVLSGSDLEDSDDELEDGIIDKELSLDENLEDEAATGNEETDDDLLDYEEEASNPDLEKIEKKDENPK